MARATCSSNNCLHLLSVSYKFSFRAWHKFCILSLLSSGRFSYGILINISSKKNAFVRVFSLTIRHFETRLFKSPGKSGSTRPPRGMKLRQWVDRRQRARAKLLRYIFIINATICTIHPNNEITIRMRKSSILLPFPAFHCWMTVRG